MRRLLVAVLILATLLPLSGCRYWLSYLAPIP